MARPSSIDKLPGKIRELIGELRANGRTIDEILDKLHELDVDVSRSALGRYTQDIDALHERLRESRAVAETVMGRIEDSSAGQVARINIELMHASLLKLMSGEVKMDGKEAMFLATALQKLASASKVDLDRELKLREEVARRTREEAAEQLDQVAAEAQAAGEKGLSAERIAQLRRDFLGVRPAA